MKNIIAVFALVCFGSLSLAMPPLSKMITVEFYPYLGSLGSNAVSVEKGLVEKATAACGSLERVSYLSEINIDMKAMSTSRIDPTGIPGAKNYHSIMMFAYPHVTGTAKVVCK